MPPVKKPSISVFFPCYNDEKSIGSLVVNSLSVLKKISSSYEVIVIDDGSKDSSREVLQHLVQKNKQINKFVSNEIKLIFHKKNKGYGGALKSGFKAATKSLVFYTDGDGQYDVKELPILLSLMTGKTNFVNGIKMTRQDPTYRIVLGNLYSLIARWGFWLPIYDVDCDFRLIKRSIIKKISLKSNSGSICIELVKKAQRAGGVFRQVSIHHYNRRFGNSQFFRLNRILSTFIELSKLWFDLMLDKFFNKWKSKSI